jgi:hypothetical protein
MSLRRDEHPHDIALLHDQVLDAIDLDLGARIFAEQHSVAGFKIDRNQLAALVATAGANGDDFALCGFSLAVSGMMMPPAVFSSASIRLTTTRSWSGRNFIDILLHGLFA